jgi:DNA-binding HxlR family transcriptional regulator
MTAVKISSTNQLNKQQTALCCPVTFTLNKIGGRWKPIIIYNLLQGARRYSELRRAIPAITEKMLIQHLKELEADKLITRKAMRVVPPHVEYKLTAVGMELTPILQSMCDWALKHNV